MNGHDIGPEEASCECGGELILSEDYKAHQKIEIPEIKPYLTDNWRYIFLFGSCIALVGVVFRVRLRESVEFADAAKRLDRAQMIEETLNKKLLFLIFL